MLRTVILRTLVFSVGTMFLLSFASAQAQEAANSIESLEVASQSGKMVIRLSLTKAPEAPPVSFTLSNPPRIALDFADTANALGRNVQDVGQDGLRSIRLGQSSGRTRVILNMSTLVGYKTRVQGNTVEVVLDNADAAMAKTSTTNPDVVTFATGGAASAHSIRDVHFQRGSAGEGKIIVDLSDNATGIDLRRRGRNIVVDFVETDLPPALERRYDVTDFGTLVNGFEVEAFGSTARLTIAASGKWEQSAYQADNRFIIEIKAVNEEELKAAKASASKFKGEKLSLNFQSIEVRSVLTGTRRLYRP